MLAVFVIGAIVLAAGLALAIYGLYMGLKRPKRVEKQESEQ